MTTYDVVIIGAGQAAMPLSRALAQAGRTVAVVERKHLGGSCVNFGCTPTKAAVASARLAHLARRGGDFGIRIGDVHADFSVVIAQARALAEESRRGLESGYTGENGNPVIVRGHARLNGRDNGADGLFRVVIESVDGDTTGSDADAGQTLIAREVVINTGTRTLVPDIPGLDAVPFITSGNWLDVTALPEHLVVLGGGYIGLEMAQFYRRMGSRVTIVDRSETVADREEPEVGDVLRPLLEAEGVVFRLNTHITGVARDDLGLGVNVAVRGDGGNGASETITASHVFVATGRRPNTDDLGLETVGLTVDDHGVVPVDEFLATPVPGLWASGDVRGGPQFTHTSWDDYRVLLARMTGDLDAPRQSVKNRIVPHAMFTDPAVARVGLTEREARDAGHPVKVAHFDMKKDGHAREFRQTDGFIKLIAQAETDRILGATVVHAEAADLVHLYVLLMNANAPYTVLRDAVIAHPTLAEAAQSATALLG